MMKPRYLSLVAALGCIACGDGVPTLSKVFAPTSTSGDTVTMSAARGPLIGRDSLTAIDQQSLPCCGMDSAGVHVQVTGGRLTFYAAASYADMVIPPGGPKPRACVQGVPSGGVVGLNNLVTMPNGGSYLLMPCTAGYFTVTLTKQLGYADGSFTTREDTLVVGRYGWERGLMSLPEQATVRVATATMSGATITMAVPDHRYSFLALSRF